MAAPSEVTILDLNGKFIMDKAISDDPEPILALQGMSWVTRKAIGLATVTLEVKEYLEPDPATSKPTMKLDIGQTLTGGITGSTEKRIMDWTDRTHTDNIFGTVKGRSRIFRGAVTGADGKLRPAVEVQTVQATDESIARFLRGEILADGSEVEGFLVEKASPPAGLDLGEDGDGLWLQSFVANEEIGWTAEQIWGFETVNGERRYTRRVVVTGKDGQFHMARLVYTFLGRE